jgi:hypothetical protein
MYLSPVGDDKEVATRELCLGMEIPGGGVSYASARIAPMLSYSGLSGQAYSRLCAWSGGSLWSDAASGVW